MTRQRKVTLASTLALIALGVAIAATRHVAPVRDPVVAKVDPRIYEDYGGHYDFGNNYIITIRREGDRLLFVEPGHVAVELWPETESKFFVRGEPGRLVFHRDATGRVDYVESEEKKLRHKAARTSAAAAAVTCTNAMVAATTGGKAADAALEILKEGGSAVDAALAAALCEIVHAGGSYVSFGGIMMLLYYDAESGRVHYLDGQYNVPLHEKNA